MTEKELKELFEIEDIRLLPEKLMEVLFDDKKHRDELYRKMLLLHNYDLSCDWFQAIYESELAQRKEKKQDFTPAEVGLLAAKLVGDSGSIHEPTAGNGSMIIQAWNNRIKKRFPWDCFPSNDMVCCWELSDRALPLLLFNLSIRGIMGYVYHGDVLERSVKCKYILLNEKDDALGFSDIIRDEKNRMTIKKDTI